LGISSESININYSCSLYEIYPLFYLKIIKYLPDTLYTKNIMYNVLINSQNKNDKLDDYIKNGVLYYDEDTIGYILFRNISIAFIYSEEIYTGDKYNEFISNKMYNNIITSLRS